MTKFVYFSWVRERIGTAEEDIVLPETVRTVNDLIGFLREHDEAHASVMEHDKVIRFAVDQEAVERDDTIVGAREIAIFPPMTGG